MLEREALVYKSGQESLTTLKTEVESEATELCLGGSRKFEHQRPKYRLQKPNRLLQPQYFNFISTNF